MSLINRIEVIKTKGVNGENQWTIYKNTMATRAFNELSCDYAYTNLVEYLEEMESNYKQRNVNYTLTWIDETGGVA